MEMFKQIPACEQLLPGFKKKLLLTNICPNKWRIFWANTKLEQNTTEFCGNSEKETQLRDYDGIIGHTTIVMVRYIFLAFEQRCHDDQKTIGGLFFACSEEIKDLSLAEALQSLLVLILDKIRSSGEFAEDVVIAMIDAIMGDAIEFIQTSRRLSANIDIYSTS